jgi:hypothetical protein
VIVPLCDGLAAYVRGDSAGAANRLGAVVPQVSRLGGSAAQQEIVLETMVHALVDAGQHEVARRMLRERLDRRPSPCDERRLRAIST